MTLEEDKCRFYEIIYKRKKIKTKSKTKQSIYAPNVRNKNDSIRKKMMPSL